MSDLRVGTIVRLPGGGEAVLRFVGSVQGKVGTFAGVELGPELRYKGKNSGDVNGVRYFEVSVPLSGLFLPYRKLLQCNVTPDSAERRFSATLQYPEHYSSPRSASRAASRVASRSASRAISRNTSMSRTPAADMSTEVASLRAELESWKTKYNEEVERYEHKLAERQQILQDLETTLNSFEPMLEESERQMRLKDERFAKYKEEMEQKVKELEDSAADALSAEVEEKLQIKDDELSKADARADDLERRVEELEETNRALWAKNKALQEKVDSMTAVTAVPTPILQERSSSSVCNTPERKRAPLEGKENLLSASGELKVYTPLYKVDPTAGRKKWCGLCEREGHESIDCPYENELF